MPLSDTTPQVILVSDESNAINLAVSGAIPDGTPGILLAGITNNTTASFLTIDAGGNLQITGSVSANFSGTQTVTGSIEIVGIPTITGSVEIVGIPRITGSVDVSNILRTTFAGIRNVATPVTAALVAGTDGTLLRGLLTDTSGRLSVNINGGTVVTNPPYDGTINAAAPSVAVQIAGRDVGGVLRAVRTDTTGSVFVSGSVRIINNDSTNRLWITGSTQTTVVFPSTQSVDITNALLPVSVSNFPIFQQITGSVSILENNVFNPFWVTGSTTTTISFPLTQSVNITNTLLPVSVSNFPSIQNITGSTFVLNQTQANPAWITGSTTINNFPSIQTVTGTVAITANNSDNPFWITGSTTTAISFPLTQSVFVTNQTQANPSWITGSVTSTTAIPSIKVTGSSVPLSASYIAGVDNTGLLKGLSVTTGGILNVTGSTQIVGIPTVTGSFFILNQTPTNPAWVTGSVALLGSITATNPSVGVSGSAAPTTASFIAGRDGSNILRPLLTDTIGRQINSSEVPWGGATAIPDRLTMIGGFYGGTATATAWSMDVFGRGLLHFETTNGGALFENTVVPVAGLDDQSVVRSVSTDRLGVTKINPFGRYETFAASTQGTVSTGTAAATVTSILTIFKSNASALTTEIRRIVVSSGGGAAGNFNFRGCFITAEGAAGTNATELALNQADGTPVSTVKFGTGAPTRTTGDIITVAMGGASTGAPFDLFNSNHAGKPIVLRPSTNEGFEIRTAIVTALTTAAQVAVTIYWVEY